MLEIKNLSFAVSEENREKEIIHDLSLTIENGKFVVITGPNGSGKSTLARLIMGIEKPISGSILLDGEDITALDITERAKRGISFAFQQPVRFKGIRVIDLLRLASGKPLGIREEYFPLRRLRISLGGRSLRARLYRPRDQLLPLRRRAQAHRDRDAPRPSDQAQRL